MEKYTDIQVRYEDRVARIVISRPDKLNAIRVKTYMELIDALREADAAPDCHLLVIEGEGGHFTAGNDLADLIAADPQQVVEGVQGIFDCISNLKKVLIAAVEGVAVGIGTTLLLHCDIVVASSKTKFRLPFANLGVCPEGASSLLLPRAVGEKTARELLLTGRFFTAEEALGWGMINRVAEPGRVAEAVEEYIVQLLHQPLDSLMATKGLLRGEGIGISQVVSNELRVFAELLEKEETRHRITAFLRH